MANVGYALHIVNASLVFCAAGLALNSVAFCRVTHLCKQVVPAHSQIGSRGTREISTINNTLLVCLAWISAVSTSLRFVFGDGSKASLVISLIVPFIVAFAMSFNSDQLAAVHVALVLLVLFLLTITTITSPQGIIAALLLELAFGLAAFANVKRRTSRNRAKKTSSESPPKVMKFSMSMLVISSIQDILIVAFIVATYWKNAAFRTLHGNTCVATCP